MKLSKVFFLSLIMISMTAACATAGDKAPAGPLDGYTIHVSAPHVMNGEVMGPFHHYCKPINDDIIQCILFESTEPNARMTEVEYMVSKKLARKVIPEWSHKKNWHDHKEEIDTGRVAVHYPTDKKAVDALVKHVARNGRNYFPSVAGRCAHS